MAKWSKPEFKSYEEAELLKQLAAKAQSHQNGTEHVHVT